MNDLPKILIVDDELIARMALEGLLLGEPYSLYYAENGVEGLEKAESLQPDVILLDVMLPKMNGFEVCRKIRSMPRLAEIPILIISTLDDRQSRISGLQAGADDFISKPFDSVELQARIGSLTRLNRFRRIVEQRHEMDRMHTELLDAYDRTIEGWTMALDLRDKETEGHSQRVTEMTVKLALKMGLKEEAIPHIWRGAMLHDIGKLGVPDAILLKPGALTEEEQEIMRRHPLYAHEWLTPIDFLRLALDIPFCHHERWDGSGYPRGLAGEEIPIAARIFAVVDVWDAITTVRAYHQVQTREEAREYIRNHAGTHFDPAVVHQFLEAF
jgi:putative two-component system response regulator